MGIADFFKKLYSGKQEKGRDEKAIEVKTEKVKSEINLDKKINEKQAIESDEKFDTGSFDESRFLRLFITIYKNLPSQNEKNKFSEKFLALNMENLSYDDKAKTIMEEYKNFIK
jgi:hypothetical protein